MTRRKSADSKSPEETWLSFMWIFNNISVLALVKWRTAVENLKHDVLTSVSAQLSEVHRSLVRGSTCPRFQLSGLGLWLGQDLSEYLWGSEFFAVWMTLDDPNPNTNTNPRTKWSSEPSGQVGPRTTDYEPLLLPSCAKF